MTCTNRSDIASGCTCEHCIAACWCCPGWFGSQQEVEGAAQLLGMSVPEFCKKWLIREWWSGDEEDIIVPAPRRDFSRYRGPRDPRIYRISFDADSNGSGFVVATWGHNLIRGFPCVFLTSDERCLIHKSKPQECRILHSPEEKEIDKPRQQIDLYWQKHQDWIDGIVRQLDES